MYLKPIRVRKSEEAPPLIPSTRDNTVNGRLVVKSLGFARALPVGRRRRRAKPW